MATLNRKTRILMAQETLSITKSGKYTSPEGTLVDFSESREKARLKTHVYRPEELEDFDDAIEARLTELDYSTTVEVRRTNSLTAAEPLAKQYRTAVHNFASAKSPGGGFLTGAQAQEEDLCRASGLYPCLKDRAQVFYNANRKSGTAFYTDHIVITPQVTVFRDADGSLREEPFQVDFLTVPAVNAGAVQKNEKKFIDDIESAMRGRLYYTLGVAVLNDVEALVTGAWGCGVFDNDPAMVARLFSEMVSKGGPFSKAFQHISFAVLDKMENGKFISPFKKRFS